MLIMILVPILAILALLIALLWDNYSSIIKMNRIKIGDKFEYTMMDANPFNESNRWVITILDIKTNGCGEKWFKVEYQDGSKDCISGNRFIIDCWKKL